MEGPMFSKELGLECFPDEQSYNQFLSNFNQSELPKFIEKLKTALESNNWAGLKTAAHTLKGASGYIGAIRCQDLSANVQRLCEEKTLNTQALIEAAKMLISCAKDLKLLLNSQVCSNSSQSVRKFRSEFDDPSDIHISTSPSINPAKQDLILPQLYSQEHLEESKVEPLSYTIKRLVPPMYSPPVSNGPVLYEDEEVDPYDEINKQWKCDLF